MSVPPGSSMNAVPRGSAGLDEAQLAPIEAILLHGGCALLLFEAPSPLPGAATLAGDGWQASWTAESWPTGEADGSWFGVALVDVLPIAAARLAADESTAAITVLPAARRDIAPATLAAMVRLASLDSRPVFAFLMRHLVEGRPVDCAAARANRSFAREFLAEAAERDGFIEVMATPEGGGLFAQGWSQTLTAGPARLASAAGELGMRDVVIATFVRDDVIAPATGFCLFGKSWEQDDLAHLDAVYFERDGRLRRLDVVAGSLLRLDGQAAVDHVATMLPRLAGGAAELAAFKRICRPRFHGEDTLITTPLPIAAALDHLLHAADGSLLAVGWLLDPTRRVRLAIIKSTDAHYAPLHPRWTRTPRPDLIGGFAADPRFEGILDPGDTMHGFIAHVSVRADALAAAQFYLELVLDDDSCLFQPLRVMEARCAERLGPVIAALPTQEPELSTIVSDHLGPFAAGLPARDPARRSGRARPMPLGEPGGRDVAALMPFRRFAELQPVFALLAGTPEAALIDLTLIATRPVASDCGDRLAEAFPFYGLSGRLVVVPEHERRSSQLQAGLEATSAGEILIWQPNVLPRERDWLAGLRAEAASLPPGLISPILVYEDGSTYYAGASAPPGDRVHCGWLGLHAASIAPGAPRAVAAAAAEIALVGRERLEGAGGFLGSLLGDSLAHVDLADRLRRTGSAVHCSGRVSFWMVEDEEEAVDPALKLIARIDATNLARRTEAAAAVRRSGAALAIVR